jgi:hypothetical protein
MSSSVTNYFSTRASCSRSIPSRVTHQTRERECCLLVLNLVSSTLPCIRQPRPRLQFVPLGDEKERWQGGEERWRGGGGARHHLFSLTSFTVGGVTHKFVYRCVLRVCIWMNTHLYYIYICTVTHTLAYPRAHPIHVSASARPPPSPRSFVSRS